MKQILVMIAVVALVGCGKKEPVQPTTPNPEVTKPEPTKAKATAVPSYGNLKRDIMCTPPPASVLMARFTSGQMTTSSMPSRLTPKASPIARGLCAVKTRSTPAGQNHQGSEKLNHDPHPCSG